MSASEIKSRPTRVGGAERRNGRIEAGRAEMADEIRADGIGKPIMIFAVNNGMAGHEPPAVAALRCNVARRKHDDGMGRAESPFEF